MKRIAITCGPAYEPIDSVRCITNHATGEIGTLLANELPDFEVTVFRGSGSTFPPPRTADVREFTTNESLLRLLQGWSRSPDVAGIFHAAALCDFKVRSVSLGNRRGLEQGSASKISSRAEEVTISLVPAPKILPALRGFFPDAWIVGWKYEVEGGVQQAFQRARDQIERNLTDACVLNGPAYGSGFALIQEGAPVAFESKQALCTALAKLVRTRS